MSKEIKTTFKRIFEYRQKSIFFGTLFVEAYVSVESLGQGLATYLSTKAQYKFVIRGA